MDVLSFISTAFRPTFCKFIIISLAIAVMIITIVTAIIRKVLKIVEGVGRRQFPH